MQVRIDFASAESVGRALLVPATPDMSGMHTIPSCVQEQYAITLQGGNEVEPSTGLALIATALNKSDSHPFHIAKNIFKHKKSRYNWLKKNDARLIVLFALSNLYMVRGKLCP